MEDVFKKYNVCDDIQELIWLNLHKSYIKKINYCINTFIGYNKNYNYNDVNNIILSLNKYFVFRKKVLYQYEYRTQNRERTDNLVIDLKNKVVNFNGYEFYTTINKYSNITNNTYFNNYYPYDKVKVHKYKFGKYGLWVVDDYFHKNLAIQKIYEILYDRQNRNIFYDNDNHITDGKLINDNIIDGMICNDREVILKRVYNNLKNSGLYPNGLVNHQPVNTDNYTNFKEDYSRLCESYNDICVMELYIENDIHKNLTKKKSNYFVNRRHLLLNHYCYTKEELIFKLKENKIRGISRLNKRELMTKLIKIKDNYGIKE